MSAALSFHHVRKGFTQTPVLSNIELTIQANEAFGLAGMNGAGKTTLIRSLLDLCAIDGGAIEIFGANHRHTAARRPLAFLPERFAPPYYLTGAEFLHYMLRLHGRPYAVEEAKTMFTALDLESAALRQPVRIYSKGMTQKLGLAAAFLSRKPLLVLDEPFSGLDPKARALVKQRLLQHRAEGGALFFSTHTLSDVEQLCDRMAILHHGVLRFVGAPEACRRHFGADSVEDAYLNCIG